jgi:hypothetical protein
MREIRPYGGRGRGGREDRPSLPLSGLHPRARRDPQITCACPEAKKLRGRNAPPHLWGGDLL